MGQGSWLFFHRITFQVWLLDELPFSTGGIFQSEEPVQVIRSQITLSSGSVRASLSKTVSCVPFSIFFISYLIFQKPLPLCDFPDYHLFYISYVCDCCFPEQEQGKPSPNHSDLWLTAPSHHVFILVASVSQNGISWPCSPREAARR